MTKQAVPSVEESRQQWDLMAPAFLSFVQSTTTDAHRGLISMLRLPEAAALLEVGCGGGGLGEVCRGLLPAGARQVLTDLSPVMVASARERNPEAEVLEADAQALPFADGTFDRYLAALNLMLVPEAGRALAEAARVLQPGGLAAFSVWGRRKNSPLMEITRIAQERRGPPVAEIRSNFHLRDKRKLRRLARAAGLELLLCWDQPMLHPALSGEEYAAQIQHTQPRLRLMLEKLPEADRAAWVGEIAKLADRRLRRRRPIMLEIRMCLLRKPALPSVSPETDAPEADAPEVED